MPQAVPLAVRQFDNGGFAAALQDLNQAVGALGWELPKIRG